MGALLDSEGRGDSAGRAGVVALDLETPACGRSQHRRHLPWELVASLERVPLPTNSQSSSPPGTVGAVSATSEGKVDRPRSKSCQGRGGESRCEKQLLRQGRVRGGGRADLAGISPRRADSEAGRAAGLCPAPGKAETHTGRWAGGRQAQSQEGRRLSPGATRLHPTPPATRSSLPGPPAVWRLAPDAATWTLLRAQSGGTWPGHPALPEEVPVPRSQAAAGSRPPPGPPSSCLTERPHGRSLPPLQPAAPTLPSRHPSTSLRARGAHKAGWAAWLGPARWEACGNIPFSRSSAGAAPA